jgi:hypothetical protein
MIIEKPRSYIMAFHSILSKNTLKQIIKSDLEFGEREELSTLPFIQKHFGSSIIATSTIYGKMYAYDFMDTSSNIMVELKTRKDNVRHNSYPDSTIGFNKIKYAIENPEKECYVIVKYTDGFWCVKITDEVKNLKPFWFRKKNGEIKYNVKIPMRFFYHLD